MVIKVVLFVCLAIIIALISTLFSHPFNVNCVSKEFYSYKLLDIITLFIQVAVALFVAYYIPKKLQVSDKLYANLIGDLEKLQLSVTSIESLVESYNISPDAVSRQSNFQKINRYFKQTTQTIEVINARAELLDSSNAKKLLAKLSLLRNEVTGNQFGAQGYIINLQRSNRLLDDLLLEIEASKLVIFKKLS